MSETEKKTVEEIEDDLTDEERAAFEAEGDPDAGAAPVGEDDGKEDAAEAKAEDGEKPAAKVEAAAEGDPGPEPEEDAGGPPSPDQVPLRAREPEKVAERLASLAAEEDALEVKLDEGEITGSEFRKAVAEVNERRSAIRWEQQKAELAGEMAEQAKANAWVREVQDFMQGAGKVIAGSRPLMVAFDEYVKQVTSDPENASLSDRQQLNKAHRQFLKDMEAAGASLGGAKEPEARKADEPSAKEAALKKAVASVKRELPPTLGRVPQSDIADTDQGKYASIDRIAATDPEAYEAAIAKLAERGEFDDYANA